MIAPRVSDRKQAIVQASKHSSSIARTKSRFPWRRQDEAIARVNCQGRHQVAEADRVRYSARRPPVAVEENALTDNLLLAQSRELRIVMKDGENPTCRKRVENPQRRGYDAEEENRAPDFLT